MPSVKVYNKEGHEIGTETLPDALFGLKWNAELVHQAIVAEEANRRSNLAHTRGRGEVRGGGKKPWRQKGTGRARHGSIRSPIWVGGGVTHGPTKDKNFSLKLNKQMRRKALLVSLSQKLREAEIMVVDGIAVPESKTKNAVRLFRSLAGVEGYKQLAGRGGRALLILAHSDSSLVRATRNLPYVDSQEARNLHTRAVLTHRYLILAKDAIPVLEATFTKR